MRHWHQRACSNVPCPASCAAAALEEPTGAGAWAGRPPRAAAPRSLRVPSVPRPGHAPGAGASAARCAAMGLRLRAHRGSRFVGRAAGGEGEPEQQEERIEQEETVWWWSRRCWSWRTSASAAVFLHANGGLGHAWRVAVAGRGGRGLSVLADNCHCQLMRMLILLGPVLPPAARAACSARSDRRAVCICARRRDAHNAPRVAPEQAPANTQSLSRPSSRRCCACVAPPGPACARPRAWARRRASWSSWAA